MARSNQAGKSLRKKLKLKMLQGDPTTGREITGRDIARRIGHDEAVVSKAIRHGKFPRVLAKIQAVLG